MTTTNTILYNIALELDRKIKETPAIGLNGKTAIVLYFFYYSKFSQKDTFADKAIHLLQETIEGIDATSSVNLREGISGIGWTLEHLNENDFIDIDMDTSFANTFDDYIYERMNAYATIGNFDYHTGVLGFCLYFIKRFQNTKSASLKATYQEYITQIIFYIENQRIHKTLENKEFKDSGFNKTEVLTYTVNFLLILLSQKTFDVIVHPLVVYNTELLLENITKNTDHKAATALCLWKAGNKLGINRIKEKAIQLLDENDFHKKSVSIHDTYVRYQLYTYLYENSQKQNYLTLRDVYKNQFNQQLHTYNIKDKPVGIWNNMTYMGLSSISMENKFPTNWDECLLITTTT